MNILINFNKIFYQHFSHIFHKIFAKFLFWKTFCHFWYPRKTANCHSLFLSFSPSSFSSSSFSFYTLLHFDRTFFTLPNSSTHPFFSVRCVFFPVFVFRRNTILRKKKIRRKKQNVLQKWKFSKTNFFLEIFTKKNPKGKMLFKKNQKEKMLFEKQQKETNDNFERQISFFFICLSKSFPFSPFSFSFHEMLFLASQFFSFFRNEIFLHFSSVF